MDGSVLGSRGWDYALKIVIVGDTSVGKTAMLLRFTDDRWDGECQPTLGVEFLTKVVDCKNLRVQLQLWDTAGQEVFRSVTQGYYRGAAGAIVMFDITNPASFKGVDQWYTDVRNAAQPHFVCALIANKIDIANNTSPSVRQQASSYAESHKILFFETSARTGAGVAQAMNGLTAAILETIERGTFLQMQKPEEPVFENTAKAPCNC
jgi:small GTP-binding protein